MNYVTRVAWVMWRKPEENDDWDFLNRAGETFEHDEDTSEDTRSDQSGVASQTTRATTFKRLKRKELEDPTKSPGTKHQARQEDCIWRVRSALHCRRYHPTSIWDYETKTP